MLEEICAENAQPWRGAGGVRKRHGCRGRSPTARSHLRETVSAETGGGAQRMRPGLVVQIINNAGEVTGRSDRPPRRR